MTAFEVDVDGRLLGDAAALRQVTSWMMGRYQAQLVQRQGVGSRLLMEFISACGESVRIREAVGVSPTKQEDEAPARVWMSVGDAAPVMGCSAQYVRKLATLGRVPAFRVGRVWLIDPSDYLEETA